MVCTHDAMREHRSAVCALMRQKLMAPDDGVSCSSASVHAPARCCGSSHALFGMLPRHTAGSTLASCVGPLVGPLPPVGPPPLVCGQNTQLRFHRASVCGSAVGGAEMLASTAGMKSLRRRQPPPEHAGPRARTSGGQVLLAPHSWRCSCATMSRSVLMRRGTPKLSCCGADRRTGSVSSSRVSTRVRLALAHDVHRALRGWGRRESLPRTAGGERGKSWRCTLLEAGSDKFCMSTEHLRVVSPRVHICVEFV